MNVEHRVDHEVSGQAESFEDQSNAVHQERCIVGDHQQYRPRRSGRATNLRQSRPRFAHSAELNVRDCELRETLCRQADQLRVLDLSEQLWNERDHEVTIGRLRLRRGLFDHSRQACRMRLSVCHE